VQGKDVRSVFKRFETRRDVRTELSQTVVVEFKKLVTTLLRSSSICSTVNTLKQGLLRFTGGKHKESRGSKSTAS
jgi:hypothetical protein